MKQSRLLAAGVAAALAFGGPSVIGRAQSAGTAPSGPFDSLHWRPIGPASMSVGDVTVSQSNPDLVYVGTGESNNRQSTSWGDGVYKSTVGGKTYTNIGL